MQNIENIKKRVHLTLAGSTNHWQLYIET
uniref:Uncharacterized protein n=1 Tax=Rhizophora mucronata TaxID=61149 RepID=A0A2P2PXW1_RHIMU